MDLKQRKLTKSEWDGIEISVSKDEIEILRLIIEGYTNVNIKINKTDSIFTHLKIEYSSQIEEFLYAKFFSDKIKDIVEKYGVSFICFGNEPASNRDRNEKSTHKKYYINVSSIVRLKSADQIRMSRLNTDNINKDTDVYEFVLMGHLESMVQEKFLKNKNWMYHYYTLSKLIKNSVVKVNKYLNDIVSTFVFNYSQDIDLLYIVKNADKIIEKNLKILKYNDSTLYNHQKKLFTSVNNPKPKLVLYIAPTGTGKTLSPIGLSENFKVIFVCAARHVGLALARSAISVNKRVAFAFGCSSAEDVRLHYFSAKEFTKDRRSGQIRKVDNTIGDKVEIIICDIRSYIPAMFYMASFNDVNNIVTYWDEPTITMDYKNHELHPVIKNNWTENIIPNFVLSSATLPKMHEITETITDFKEKFPEAEIFNIVSNDCRKTIPIINKNGYVVMPHYLYENYDEILNVVLNCEENLTLLRYFDLKEASEFIYYVETNDYNKTISKFDRNFASVDDIDMQSIKIYYLKLLKHIKPEFWKEIYNHFKFSRKVKITENKTIDSKGNTITRNNTFPCQNIGEKQGNPITKMNSIQNCEGINETHNTGNCGVYFTTKDAHTLTDGPTIFLANDLQKIAKFSIQQANIPSSVMNSIMEKIEYNNQINERIDVLEKELALEELKVSSKMGGGASDNSKEAKKLMGTKNKEKTKIANKIVDKTEDRKISKFRDEILTLKTMAKNATLDEMFIPNRISHLEKWAKGLETKSAFTSNIEDDIIISIMLLKDVSDSWKILLLLGIGVFTEHKSSTYTEIMKKMADQQKLYLIIADSDYIYGTNYQFCHGYISKDLELTQEKIIQALGRIGRNNIQQEYSVRFRDDQQISVLFTKTDSNDKPEVINMNRLFNSEP